MLNKINKKITLLAVSGGPDSMFLLNKLKNKNIVAAHVNYHLRADSNVDQQIVEKFCQKHKIKLEILSSEKKYEDYQNIQHQARLIRYHFFSQIYKKYNCKQLIIAHQKDDFIETVFLQKMKKKEVNYWGIKKKNFLYNMNITRIFLFKYFKEEIINLLNKKNIHFAIDSSNSKDIYQRNKIRHKLATKSKIWKNLFILKYRFLNIIKIIKFIRINFLLSKWEKSNFDISFFWKKWSKNLKFYIFLFINIILI
ncbi:tRNA lysidine(34) synthetase TilS [Mesomycoplasma hyorhinis]|uniref:tRNA(Ile)-lysidine synthase n=1 Tax=Mesomycoplasma hyorhinis (strain MCLD) TaxID=936139 RepID=A0ABM5M739_MESHM|nr:tRNA(Ile)-lysidine synthase [Mesomycoplasma hyorhinis MCLD]